MTDPIAARFRAGGARVEVIRNLVKLGSLPSAGPSGGRGPSPRADDQGLLVLGGTITQDRCMDELVDAMGLLHRRGLSLRLLCVGGPHPPGYGEQLIERAARRGIAGRVAIEASMPFEEYQRQVARTRLGMVLYAPGINNTMGVPNRLYEFMAHGVAVVSSDFPEVARVVRDADCGTLVDSSDPALLADAMEFLLTHPEEAERLGANGQRAIEDRYCWEREVQTLVDFYQKLAGPVPELSPAL